MPRFRHRSCCRFVILEATDEKFNHKSRILASRDLGAGRRAVAWCGRSGRGRPAEPARLRVAGGVPPAGGHFVNTSGTPTLTEANGTTLTGVVFNGIAVFDFDSFDLPSVPGAGHRHRVIAAGLAVTHRCEDRGAD